MATRDAAKLEMQRQRRNANRAARRAAAAASANLCNACAKRPREDGKKWCTECLDRQRDAPAPPRIAAPAAIATKTQPRPRLARRERPELDFAVATDDEIAELERIFA